MKDDAGTPVAAEYVAATQWAFSRCPNLSGLRLVSVEARFDFLTIVIEGPVDDFRGPYGGVICLPRDRQDAARMISARDRATELEGGQDPVRQWAHVAVAMRALNVHQASALLARGYTSDGIWWLIDDTPRSRTTVGE
jgi:hypothetical protein